MTETALRATTGPALPRGLRRDRRLLHVAVPPSAAVSMLVLGAAAARLPLLTRPLSPDEGGFLMVAAQWSPGTSLYGDYWVDRPPLLIVLFRLADLGGGVVALRLMGVAAAVLSVLLAAEVGRRVAPGRRYAAVATAATAAVFLSSPLFGSVEVNGELLAVPMVLAGIVAALRGSAPPPRSARWAWWTAAGIAAAAAASVKQSMLEGFVVVLVVVCALLYFRRPRMAAGTALAFGIGATATIALVVWWASLHGTSPGGLWDAVVTFRAQAAAVISQSAPDTTPRRALGLATSFAGSGALALLVLSVLPSRWSRGPRGAAVPHRAPLVREGGDARLLAAAVLAWEAFAVSAGGSYWHHYLIGTVPGLVLTVAAVARHRPQQLRWASVVLTYAAVVAVAAVLAMVIADRRPSTDTEVERYLAAHAQPGDTAVVAFGDPALLEGAGLGSPYPELWSLPVRVRDPDLNQLDKVLEGPNRPVWVVVSGSSIATWGIDASTAQPILRREYRPVQVFGDWHIYHLRAADRRSSVMKVL